METVQAIITILVGLSGACFLLLAVFDKPVEERQLVITSAESGFSIPAAVRLLRGALAKLQLASAKGHRGVELPERTLSDLEKAA